MIPFSKITVSTLLPFKAPEWYNPWSSIIFTVLGIVSSLTPVFPANIQLLITSKLDGKIKDVKPELANASFPISFTLSGSIAVARYLFPLKAPSPIAITVYPSITPGTVIAETVP